MKALSRQSQLLPCSCVVQTSCNATRGGEEVEGKDEANLFDDEGRDLSFASFFSCVLVFEMQSKYWINGVR